MVLASMADNANFNGKCILVSFFLGFSLNTKFKILLSNRLDLGIAVVEALVSLDTVR